MFLHIHILEWHVSFSRTRPAWGGSPEPARVQDSAKVSPPSDLRTPFWSLATTVKAACSPVGMQRHVLLTHMYSLSIAIAAKSRYMATNCQPDTSPEYTNSESFRRHT